MTSASTPASASKRRPLWQQLPASVRSQIERMVDGGVVGASNCPGGFSPGFASRLSLADGRRVFVKAMDVDAWPGEAVTYRSERHVAEALSWTALAPRLLGTFDDGHWVGLAFEDIDGAEPVQPWRADDLARVVAAVRKLSQASSPAALPDDHPRLGGWRELAGDRSALARLPAASAWAAEQFSALIELEEAGLAAAQGSALVHFDLYPHNILLTPERVVFVDWPHARLGAPIVDLVIVLASAAGVDPEPFLRDPGNNADVEPRIVDAVLAAHAGFCLAGSLYPAPPGLQPIVDAKRRIGLGAIEWLRRRLASRR